MSTKSQLQSNYDENAAIYNQFLSTPLGTLEQQLFDLCITKLAGQKVLDLGGGTGLRGRDALNAGAVHVDVIDISPEMMRLGQVYEANIGRSQISWYEGDVSKSLGHLPLNPYSYDMVIANGIFDHAHNDQELEGMWRNANIYLKPGGRIVANRNNPSSNVASTGKYGVTLSDFKYFDGGFSYNYRMDTQPPLEFKSFALDSYITGSLDIPGKFFGDFRNVPWQETPVVKADLEFWQAYLDDPILYIFTARKLEGIRS